MVKVNMPRGSQNIKMVDSVGYEQNQIEQKIFFQCFTAVTCDTFLVAETIDVKEVLIYWS